MDIFMALSFELVLYHVYKILHILILLLARESENVHRITEHNLNYNKISMTHM